MQTFDMPFEYNGAAGNVFIQQTTNHRSSELHIFLTDDLKNKTGLSYFPAVRKNNVFHLSAEHIPLGTEPVCTAILKALESSPLFHSQPVLSRQRGVDAVA